MKENQYKLIRNGLIILIVIILLIIGVVTIDVINETENWVWFDLDFTRKESIISAYGGIIGSVLSFLSILLVLFDLIYQRRLNTKKDESIAEEEINIFKDKIEIIQLFIEKLLNNCEQQFNEFQEFVSKENAHPTEMNMMSFISNSFSKMILDEDKNLIYKAIRFFKPTENWKKSYVDLLRIVDFYDKATPELMKRYQIHADKKYKLSSEIALELDRFNDLISEKRNYLIRDNLNTKRNPFFVLLHTYHDKIKAITQKRNEMSIEEVKELGDPASFETWVNDVLKPFFDELIGLINIYQDDPFNVESILSVNQNLLRNIERLKKDSLDYSNHINEYSTKYYSPESSYISILKEIDKGLSKI